MDHEHRSDRFTAVEEQYAGYTVVDESGSKIGKVDDLFLDENDQPEYFGVKMGFLGTSSTLIPADIATTDDERSIIEVSQPKSTVQDGPAFDDDREITPDYENQVRSYYGLGAVESTEDRGTYGDYEAEHSDAGTTSDLEDKDELRVQRSEEELVAGTREREAGAIKVRKRVRTDRERIEVPTKHEEVSVERVPVSGEATEAQIGEDEVVMPVTEAEVRIRKDVVEDTEVVEEDVRREEIDVEDETKRRGV